LHWQVNSSTLKAMTFSTSFEKRVSLPLLVTWLACVVSLESAPVAERLEQWPHWRGPHANGVAYQATPPLHWSSTENIHWKTSLPGQGTSTPIIWEDRIFLLSVAATERVPETLPIKDERALTEPPGVIVQFLVLCLDRTTGNILWQRIAREEAPHEGHHKTHTYAGGSPCTDGERLYVSFGSMGVYAYDFSGNLLWKRDLGKMRSRLGWGEASTPVVHGSNLIVPWDQEDQSRLFNLDARTGKTRWKMDRDEPSNWSTPLVLEHEGKTQVVVNGTRRARGYDLASGQVLWECGDLSVNAIPSPVAADGLIFCMSGYRKSILYAIPYGARGDISNSDSIAWSYTRDTPYVSSPLLFGGNIFMIKNRSALLTILEAATGNPLLKAERIPNLTNLYASPMAANGRIYLVDREGTCTVLQYDGQVNVLATNRLNDTIDASPVAVGRQLFLRSWSRLYCIQAD
jgi:outer membrane protein assembly factor BamB